LLEVRFPPEPDQLRSLRERVRGVLEELAADEQSVNKVVLVIDEMVANAIEHADPYRGSSELLLRLTQRGQDVALDFEDPDVPADVIAELGAMLATGSERRPPVESERGRGLFLMATGIDQLEVSGRTGGGMRLTGCFPRVVG